MDPTTLFTFIFHAPPEVRCVELIGSWDNFTHPYRMYHDSRRGRGVWTGCFKFQDIVFDGDQPHWTRPRTGGLKQGGTYWYYFRLDDVVEAYDDHQPFTSKCPLLPGQSVNVLHVPWEQLDRPTSRRSICFDARESLQRLNSTHTLDPSDKFAALEPPPVSRVHGRCISDLALNGRLENPTNGASDTSPSPPRPSPSRKSHWFDALGLHTRRRRASARDSCSRTSSRSSSHVHHASNLNSPRLSVVDVEPIASAHLEQAESLFSFSPRAAPECDSVTSDDVRPPDDGYRSSCSAGNWPLPAEKSTDAKAGDNWHTQASYRQCASKFSLHDSNVNSSERPSSRRACYSAPASISALSPDYIHHNVDSDANGVQDSNFELCSPTFSATTISSYGGDLHTPWRLSRSCSRSTTTNDFLPDFDSFSDEKGMYSIAERLRSLKPRSRSEERTGKSMGNAFASSRRSANRHSFGPPVFAVYSLPEVAEESVQSLGKLVSSPRASNTSRAQSQHSTPPPVSPMSSNPPAAIPSLLLPMAPSTETSFSDDIFSELSFLGSSIS